MKLMHLALGLSFAICPSYVLAAQAGVVMVTATAAASSLTNPKREFTI